MKTLILLVALGAVVWFLAGKAKQNAAVQQVREAPEKYVKTLQSDAARAKQVAEQANKAVQRTFADVQKAVDADR